MMSENPGYQTDNLLASTVAHFPSGTLFHAFSTPIYATRVKENLNEIQAELGRSYRKNTFSYSCVVTLFCWKVHPTFAYQLFVGVF